MTGPGRTNCCTRTAATLLRSVLVSASGAGFTLKAHFQRQSVSICVGCKMKTRRRILIFGAIGVAVVVALMLVASAYWQRRQTPFQNLPGLITALQAFVRDQTRAGQRLPTEIPLSDLVRGGYLTTNDVRAFEGMDVAFSTQVDDRQPQAILVRARMPDGQFICALADGSVQQFSRERYEQQRKNAGQPDSGADVSQPFRPEANPAPGAAGSIRSP
jgi:hypothetical protein